MATQLLTRAELAAALRVSKETISRWTKAGRIPHIRSGQTLRFNLDEVLEALHADRTA